MENLGDVRVYMLRQNEPVQFGVQDEISHPLCPFRLDHCISALKYGAIWKRTFSRNVGRHAIKGIAKMAALNLGLVL